MDLINELITKFSNLLMKVLPTSPFTAPLKAFSQMEGLAYVNWFLPISDCIVVLTSWLSSLALYYMYSAIMRHLNII